MNPSALRVLTLLFLLASATTASGQDDARDAERQAEIERQKIFRAGFQEIVNDLNRNSFERFTRAIDQEDMLERIFGLRLIDPKVKQSFREDFEQNIAGIVQSAFANTGENMRVAWLGFGSRGERGKAIVRFDLPDFQFNYHEYELRLDSRGRVIIVDWTNFMDGEKFSDGMGIMLIRASPRESAMRKLFDFQGPTEQQTFQMTELQKAARDRNVKRYFEILGNADEKVRRQRAIVLTSVHLTKAVRDRRKLRTALIDVDKYFPEEPLFSLMLLDYYFPSRKYDQAMAALLRLQQRLGVVDPAMDARLSAAALVMENTEDAAAYAERAVAGEPGLELAWWSALRARVAMKQYAAAVEALDVLEKDFGYTLDQAGFEKDPTMAGLLQSDEYEAWFLAHE